MTLAIGTIAAASGRYKGPQVAHGLIAGWFTQHIHKVMSTRPPEYRSHRGSGQLILRPSPSRI